MYLERPWSLTHSTKLYKTKNKAAGKSMVVKNDYKKNSENKRIMAQNDQDNITGTIKDNPSLLF